jgi:hypothetical protein
MINPLKKLEKNEHRENRENKEINTLKIQRNKKFKDLAYEPSPNYQFQRTLDFLTRKPTFWNQMEEKPREIHFRPNQDRPVMSNKIRFKSGGGEGAQLKNLKNDMTDNDSVRKLTKKNVNYTERNGGKEGFSQFIERHGSHVENNRTLRRPNNLGNFLRDRIIGQVAKNLKKIDLKEAVLKEKNLKFDLFVNKAEMPRAKIDVFNLMVSLYNEKLNKKFKLLEEVQKHQKNLEERIVKIKKERDISLNELEQIKQKKRNIKEINVIRKKKSEFKKIKKSDSSSKMESQKFPFHQVTSNKYAQPRSIYIGKRNHFNEIKDVQNNSNLKNSFSVPSFLKKRKN